MVCHIFFYCLYIPVVVFLYCFKASQFKKNKFRGFVLRDLYTQSSNRGRNGNKFFIFIFSAKKLTRKRWQLSALSWCHRSTSVHECWCRLWLFLLDYWWGVLLDYWWVVLIFTSHPRAMSLIQFQLPHLQKRCSKV